MRLCRLHFPRVYPPTPLTSLVIIKTCASENEILRESGLPSYLGSRKMNGSLKIHFSKLITCVCAVYNFRVFIRQRHCHLWYHQHVHFRKRRFCANQETPEFFGSPQMNGSSKIHFSKLIALLINRPLGQPWRGWWLLKLILTLWSLMTLIAVVPHR